MTTRRYRFVEDGLMIGRPESEEVVELTRGNFKLWNRVEDAAPQPLMKTSYRDLVAQCDERMFAGFSDLLESSAKKHCPRCLQATSNRLEMKQFGGIRLCEDCKEGWRSYMRAFPKRFAAAFPEIN